MPKVIIAAQDHCLDAEMKVEFIAVLHLKNLRVEPAVLDVCSLTNLLKGPMSAASLLILRKKQLQVLY
jgi:hypothetical protein